MYQRCSRAAIRGFLVLPLPGFVGLVLSVGDGEEESDGEPQPRTPQLGVLGGGLLGGAVSVGVVSVGVGLGALVGDFVGFGVYVGDGGGV